MGQKDADVNTVTGRQHGEPSMAGRLRPDGGLNGGITGAGIYA